MPAEALPSSCSIRNKLLAWSLLPLLVVLPLLALLLLRLGQYGVRPHADHQGTQRPRGGERLLRARARRVSEQKPLPWPTRMACTWRDRCGRLHVLLQQAKSERERLDFLNLRAADGTLLVTDWGVPSGVPQPDAASRPEQRLDRRAERPARPPASKCCRRPRSPHWRPRCSRASRCRIVPRSWRRAGRPRTEDRAMVMLALAPMPSARRSFARLRAGRRAAEPQPVAHRPHQRDRLPRRLTALRQPRYRDVCSSATCASAPTCDCLATSARSARAYRRPFAIRCSERGSTWLDRAFVVDDWYVSGYQPLTDGAGQRVGMLYVGYLERPFTQVEVRRAGRHSAPSSCR